MSGSATHAAGEDSEAVIEGDVELGHIRETLAKAREELLYKIEKGRVRDESKERVRVKQYRALAYICKVELNAYESGRLEELQSELEELRELGVDP